MNLNINRDNSEDCNRPFTMTELQQAIKKLKKNMTPGINNILTTLNQIIEKYGPKIAFLLCGKKLLYFRP